MSGQSVTKIVGGPALISYRGASFYSQGDITLELAIDTFPVEVDAYRQVDERVRGQPIRVRFTPAGEWESLAVLFAYAGIPFGDLITPVRGLGTICPPGTVTCLKHKLQNGDAVYAVTIGGTLPTGLVASTLYYVHATNVDAITFHTNRADAIAGTNVITVSGGSGTNKIVVNNPLTIQTMDSSAGQLITLYNAAVTRMPGIIGSATATLLGEVEFEAFLVDGKAPGDAGAYYAIADSPYLQDTTFDPANLLTQPIALAWGAAPWDVFYTKAGVRVDFALTLENVDIDGLGTVTKRLGGLVVTARGQPVGVTEAQLFTALKLQGAGAGIGRSLGSGASDLVLTATGFYAKLTAAALKGGPEQFSSRNDRIGELTWTATRTFTGGVPNALFVVGTSVPT